MFSTAGSNPAKAATLALVPDWSGLEISAWDLNIRLRLYPLAKKEREEIENKRA